MASGDYLIMVNQPNLISKVNATLNAWALINNLRTFLPDAKRAGQSLVKVFGALLRGIAWIEALNLCTVGRLEDSVPASG